MNKLNPGRQDLIQFINSVDPDLPKINKIEDLASGVHYLYLLHKIYPNVVKLTKINLKSFHEHENINNLKLLSTYISQVQAPFTVEVQKVASRNYQENLNLLKNLYKYFFTKQNNNRSESADSTNAGAKVMTKKPEQKLIIKPPQKINKKSVLKKIEPEQTVLKQVLDESKACAEQLKKILKVVKGQQEPKNQKAEQKLLKIKKILGLSETYSSKNKKQIQNINYSNLCSGSKTQRIQDLQETKQQIQGRTEEKTKNLTIEDIQPKNEVRKDGKSFDCEAIKRSVLTHYNVANSKRKSFGQGRASRPIQKFITEGEEDDSKYNECLLTPQPEKRQSHIKKSINNKTQNRGSLISDRKAVSNRKNMNLSVEKIKSTKKYSIEKKQQQNVEENRIISSIKKSEKKQYLQTPKELNI